MLMVSYRLHHLFMVRAPFVIQVRGALNSASSSSCSFALPFKKPAHDDGVDRAAYDALYFATVAENCCNAS